MDPSVRASRLGPATGFAAIAVGAGVLLAWHPADPVHATELTGLMGRWLTIHLGLLVAMPLLALGVLHLLRDVRSTAATLARALIVPAAALYAAFDALLGIGTGVLVAQTGQLQEDLQPGAVALTQAWWEVPTVLSLVSALAIVTWTASVASAGIVAHRSGLGPVTAWALVASSVTFALGHPGVTGALGMAGLATAMVAAERQRRTGAGPSGLDRSRKVST